MSRKNNSYTGVKVVLILLILVMLAATAFLIKLCLDLPGRGPDLSASQPAQLPEDSLPTETTEAPTETTMPVPEHVVSTATIGSMGDILMHLPVVNTGDQGGGNYDFESIFRYLTEYTSALDYAAANLETTLCGTDNGFAYSGYPHFNCPDEIVEGAKNAGFDMLLTANNHSYDTTLVGYKRTLEVARGAGLDTLGTYASPDETKWFIREVNGINIGMLCYTYATGAVEGRPQLNGNAAIAESGLCNYFLYEDLPAFYEEVEGYLEEMAQAGAEATMMYIHWGVEYQLTANDQQKAIAQALCDLGIDVIVGGHPHVVQPVELLTSTTDPEQKTVCLYSMGNAVSNQRLGNISYVKTAHTEDGILFTVTFEKYSDGTVYLADAEAIPTWVNMHNNDAGKREYNILPLDMDRREEWNDLFEIGDATAGKAEASYDRTWAIVGDGLKEARDYLAQAKADREQYYYDLAFFPEKFQTEATEAPTELPTVTAPAA